MVSPTNKEIATNSYILFGTWYIPTQHESKNTVKIAIASIHFIFLEILVLQLMPGNLRGTRVGHASTARGTAVAAARRFRQITTPLTVEVTYRAVFHHVHKEHIEHFIAVGSRGKARRRPKPGGVVNECDAEPNPALHLFPIRGHRVLAKLDRGLSSQNEWLHIEFVVFIWAHQITQIFLRCAGCNHFMDVFVGGFTATKS